jgi:hypothetical protein
LTLLSDIATEDLDRRAILPSLTENQLLAGLILSPISVKTFSLLICLSRNGSGCS